MPRLAGACLPNRAHSPFGVWDRSFIGDSGLERRTRVSSVGLMCAGFWGCLVVAEFEEAEGHTRKGGRCHCDQTTVSEPLPDCGSACWLCTRAAPGRGGLGGFGAGSLAHGRGARLLCCGRLGFWCHRFLGRRPRRGRSLGRRFAARAGLARSSGLAHRGRIARRTGATSRGCLRWRRCGAAWRCRWCGFVGHIGPVMVSFRIKRGRGERFPFRAGRVD